MAGKIQFLLVSVNVRSYGKNGNLSHRTSSLATIWDAVYSSFYCVTLLAPLNFKWFWVIFKPFSSPLLVLCISRDAFAFMAGLWGCHLTLDTLNTPTANILLAIWTPVRGKLLCFLKLSERSGPYDDPCGTLKFEIAYFTQNFFRDLLDK